MKRAYKIARKVYHQEENKQESKTIQYTQVENIPSIPSTALNFVTTTHFTNMNQQDLITMAAETGEAWWTTYPLPLNQLQLDFTLPIQADSTEGDQSVASRMQHGPAPTVYLRESYQNYRYFLPMTPNNVLGGRIGPPPPIHFRMFHFYIRADTEGRTVADSRPDPYTTFFLHPSGAYCGTESIDAAATPTSNRTYKMTPDQVHTCPVNENYFGLISERRWTLDFPTYNTSNRQGTIFDIPTDRNVDQASANPIGNVGDPAPWPENITYPTHQVKHGRAYPNSKSVDCQDKWYRKERITVNKRDLPGTAYNILGFNVTNTQDMQRHVMVVSYVLTPDVVVTGDNLKYNYHTFYTDVSATLGMTDLPDLYAN